MLWSEALFVHARESGGAGHRARAMCARAARRGRGAARNSHVFQAAVCGPLGSSVVLRGPVPARSCMQRCRSVCDEAFGSRDRRGLCLATHGTGNETRQVLTWGDAPYPSATQPELLVSGKAPFFGNPRCTVRAGHAVKPLDTFVKLLAS